MAADTTLVPRKFRFRLALIPVARWLVPAWRCLALPVAVKRNRFFVPLCVFCFGIVSSHNRSAQKPGGPLAGQMEASHYSYVSIGRNLTWADFFLESVNNYRCDRGQRFESGGHGDWEGRMDQRKREKRDPRFDE